MLLYSTLIYLYLWFLYHLTLPDMHISIDRIVGASDVFLVCQKVK